MKLVLSWLLLLLLGSSVLPTKACSCGHYPFLEAVAEADQLFIGIPTRKVIGHKAHYSFAITRVFKGQPTDTTTIETGLGGPDCGFVFEIGKPYLVFASSGRTSRCGRTAAVSECADLGKLYYTFYQSFADSLGQNASPLLNSSEAQYFNSELRMQRDAFNFAGQRTAFFTGKTLSDKQQYLHQWAGRDVANALLVLTPAEKLRSGGFDAVIIAGRDHGVKRGLRRQLLNQLRHGH